MSGSRLLLDTNAVVALLKGNQAVLALTQQAAWIGISVITQIEFLSFSRLAESDRMLFEKFLERVDVIDLQARDMILLDRITGIRKTAGLRLPDAIVAATTIVSGATLVTADRKLAAVQELAIQSFEP